MQLITIYHCGAFGGSTVRGKLVKIGDSGNFKTLTYVEKGKRKETRISSKTMLVVLGHNPANAPSGLVKKSDNSEISRYGCFDPRYYTDFNKWATLLKGSIPSDIILIDQKEYEGETEPTEDRE